MRLGKKTLSPLMVIILFAVPLDSRPPAPHAFTILLANDDGYDAPGLRALEQALAPVARLIVAAPVDDESGVSQSITIGRPIYVNEKKQPNGATWYAIQATPATCVSLALEALTRHRPDLVISGINRGENLGEVVYYSGTVGAAREAAMMGLPAMAVSIEGDNLEDYAAAASYVRELVEKLRSSRLLKPGLFLNVNVPAGTRQGVRVTRLSLQAGSQSYQRRTGPDGRPYYLSMWRPPEENTEETDVGAFAQHYITLTPMGLDVTETNATEALRALTREPAEAGR